MKSYLNQHLTDAQLAARMERALAPREDHRCIVVITIEPLDADTEDNILRVKRNLLRIICNGRCLFWATYYRDAHLTLPSWSELHVVPDLVITWDITEPR